MSQSAAAREYTDIETARAARGLRVALTRGVPGPWSESAKSILWVKQIPYLAVAQEGGGANEALLAWTGHANAPLTMYDDEAPRSGWIEILQQAERIAPTPALIPAGVDVRAKMFGYTHEIAGENGLGWSRRLMMLDSMLPKDGDPLAGEGIGQTLARRYGFSRETAKQAPARCIEILREFSKLLRMQRDAGSRYLIGRGLTALDIYWACFAALLDPLPPERCPMPEWLRPFYDLGDAEVRAALDPELLRHRDYIYETHLELPIRL